MPVLILGGGGHARVLISALRENGLVPRGVLSPGMQPGTLVLDVQVLGDDALLQNYPPGEVDLINGLGSLPGENRRWRLAEFCRSRGYRFLRVVHPGACIADQTTLEEGVQIMAGCIIQTGVSVGQDSIINTGSVIDHDCRIGAFCHVAPGCTLSGGVRLGDGVHLGTGSVVIQGISIGEGSVIGSGAVIYADIPPSVRVIQKREAMMELLPLDHA